VEPNPVTGNPIPVDEEPTEEQEICENGHNNGVTQHHVRHHTGKERHEGVPGPKRSENNQKIKQKARETTVQAHGPESDCRESQREKR